ncbi:MAG TPA: oxidoreductase [Legionellales bacterium]|nr:oxidoreductase [Legionellales bacterium]
MKKVIKIIGAGQLGSRHLQALKSVSIPLKIEVIDAFQGSLDTAKERYESIPGFEYHELEYSLELKSSEDTDVAIIATNADVRKQVIEDLLNSTRVKNLIIEKIMFNEPEEYAVIEALLIKHQVNAWVNCPMRMMPSYQNIHEMLESSPINYRVTGGAFGLMTNAIHYLDHVAHLSACDAFSLDLSGLSPELIPSKRKSFYEITGRLTAIFSDGSRCEMIEELNSQAPVLIEIFNQNHRYIIRENQRLAWYSGELNNWQWSEIQFDILFQSQMTGLVVEKILQENQCDLTPFASSKKIHLQLLNPIQNFEKFQEEEFLFT